MRNLAIALLSALSLRASPPFSPHSSEDVYKRQLFTGIRTHANIHLPAFEKLEAILGDVMEFLLRHGQFIAQLVLDALRCV